MTSLKGKVGEGEDIWAAWGGDTSALFHVSFVHIFFFVVYRLASVVRKCEFK